jgi:serine/threonine-protein kinase RsbW
MTTANPMTSSVLTGNCVRVAIPADPALIPSVRAVAVDLAIREEFDLDRVADLRLAVDEVCAILVQRAAPDAELTCMLAVSESDLRLVAECLVRTVEAPAEISFGWQLLDALCDGLSATVVPQHDEGGPLLQIEVSLSRLAG